MNLKLVSKLFAVVLVGINLLAPAGAWAEVAVVVHPSNHNNFDKMDISRLYLGRKNTFPDGSIAEPVDQADQSLVRAAFVSAVLNRTSQRLKSYWAELMFTGRGTPPKEVDDDEDVKKIVSENPAAIGYIDAAAVDATVRVVYSF